MENITNNITEKETQTAAQAQTTQAQATQAQATQAQATQTAAQAQATQAQTNLKDIPIENENVALNVLVGMLNIAQKRGAFNMEESAKAWECVQMFMKPSQ
jgi:hypothetical protein